MIAVASYETLKAFPAPQVICNEQDRKWALRNAKHLFNNVKKHFLRQSSNGPGTQTSDRQTITVGHDTSDGPALWVRSFTGDGKVLDWPLQEKIGIDFCNQQLEGTGWRVVEILPTLVHDTTVSGGYAWYYTWDNSSAWEKSMRPLREARRCAERSCREHESNHEYRRYHAPLEDMAAQIERERRELALKNAEEVRDAFRNNNPRPKMPALNVVMEYTCQSAAKYPGQ